MATITARRTWLPALALVLGLALLGCGSGANVRVGSGVLRLAE